MPLLLQTDALILRKEPPGDTFQRYSAFCAEHGVLTLFQRVPRKTSPTYTPLDLFDDVALALETRNAPGAAAQPVWFIREARVLRRRGELALRYEALTHACDLAALVLGHPIAAESRPAVGALLVQALDAFATSARPDVTWLKALYCFARDEGLPVKQEWWASLPAADRDTTASCLNRPLDTQTASHSEVARLTHRLATYLREHEVDLADQP